MKTIQNKDEDESVSFIEKVGCGYFKRFTHTPIHPTLPPTPSTSHK